MATMEGSSVIVIFLIQQTVFLCCLHIWKLKMGLKAAYEQCHNSIAYIKSWESLQWAQPLTHAGCLSETHLLQPQSPFEQSTQSYS